jgi:hypothetical protein
MKQTVSYFDNEKDFTNWVSKETDSALIRKSEPLAKSRELELPTDVFILQVLLFFAVATTVVLFICEQFTYSLWSGILTVPLMPCQLWRASKMVSFEKLVDRVANHPAEVCEEFRDLRDLYMSLRQISQPDEAVDEQKEECRLLLVETFKKAVIAANMERDFYPVPEDTEAIRSLVSERMSQARTVLQTATQEEQKAHEELRLSVGA